MRQSSMIPGLVAVLALAACAPTQPPSQADAAAASAPVVAPPPPPEPTAGTAAPIFSQLVYFHVPTRFVSVYEKRQGAGYVHEWLPPGETTANWTQMVSATGFESLAAKHRDATPKALATNIAAGFQRACPTSFVAKSFYEGQLFSHDAFVMVVGCGSAAASGGHSETTAITVIKGAKDFYTLQWAERGNPTQAPQIDDALWASRIKTLMPFKLCPIKKKEKAPYPSCVA
ncbi:hypothetical protein [Burkholderia guangdongensis]|uniref:hypothetical protein n=1 Tax=Burkholderia guangdongensis TaxID=1792500 RepID=UPI0015C91F4C|nr:hypothetical protein [Burkholderia guangdongensis]